MQVYNIDATDPELLRRVIAIHDDMPSAWDPGHRVAPEHLVRLGERLRANPQSNAIWVLARPSTLPSADRIQGMLWASLKSSIAGETVCCINSFWIDPQLRGKKFAPLLAAPCLPWARANGAVRIECDTHIKNRRMTGILEKNGFTPGMIQYSLAI